MDARIETTAPSTGHAGVPRSVVLAGAAVVGLIVIALVVTVVLPHGPTTYPAGSPEAAFQSFYRSWETGDLEGAYSHLSSSVTRDMSLADYRRRDSEQSWQRDQDRRLVLLGVDLTGERAVLHVRVDEFSGGGLGGGRSSYERSVRLAREGGAWLIDEPLAGIESFGYPY